MSLIIPFSEAERIAESYCATRVVIWAYAPATDQCVATWGGPSLRDSFHAAEAGRAIKLAAGWPAEAAQAVPQSFVTLFEKLEAKLIPSVADGTLHKGTVMAALMTLRDIVGEEDAEWRREGHDVRNPDAVGDLIFHAKDKRKKRL